MSKLPKSVPCRKNMTGIASKSLENSFKMFEFFFFFLLIYLLAFFSRCMSKLPHPDRWNEETWLRDSKLLMWRQPQWLVSLPRSGRKKNGDQMSRIDEQMCCKLPCLVEWRSSYSGRGCSRKKSLYPQGWRLLRKLGQHSSKELQLLLYLRVALPRVLLHPLLQYWLIQLQIAKLLNLDIGRLYVYFHQPLFFFTVTNRPRPRTTTNWKIDLPGLIFKLKTILHLWVDCSNAAPSHAQFDRRSRRIIRELKQTTTATATGTLLNKRFNEQNNSCARAL